MDVCSQAKHQSWAPHAASWASTVAVCTLTHRHVSLHCRGMRLRCCSLSGAAGIIYITSASVCFSVTFPGLDALRPSAGGAQRGAFLRGCGCSPGPAAPRPARLLSGARRRLPLLPSPPPPTGAWPLSFPLARAAGAASPPDGAR